MNAKNICLNTLSKDAHWMVNKKIAKETNNDTAILLADFIAKYHYFEKRDGLTNDGYFFNTAKNIENDTNIKRNKQKTCIQLLEKKNLIKTKLHGMPARKHFKPLFTEILNLVYWNQVNKFTGNQQSCLLESSNDNKNKDNKNKDNNIKLHSCNSDEFASASSVLANNEKKTSKTTPTKFDIKMANKLKKIISQHIKVNRNANTKKWQQEMRKLRSIDKVSCDRIRRVLNWYKNNIGGEFIPEAFSGKAFREKFPKLEAAIKREQNNMKSKPAKIDNKIQKLAHKLYKKYDWKHHTKTELEDLINITVTNYKQFYKKHKKYIKKEQLKMQKWEKENPGETKTNTFLSFAQKISKQLVMKPSVFIKFWAKQVNKIIHNWGAFKGKLDYFAFTEDNEEFHKFGYTITKNITTRVGAWQTYFKAVKNK